MTRPWSPFNLTSDERIPTPLAFLFLAVYVAGTLYVGLHHEPWRDEADAWLVVRDAPIDSILDWTHAAGTPALWYVLLKPLIWLRLPYPSETIANLAVAWAAAAVLVFLAPLTRLTKLLVLASYFFAYEYSVIARSYSLTILLLFVAIWAGSKRPLLFAVMIAMLFNANVHGAVIAAILVFLARPRALVPIITMAGGALIAFLQLYPSYAVGNVRQLRLFAIPAAIGDAFIPGAPVLVAFIAGLAVFITLALALRSVFLVVTTAVLLAIYTFVWFGGLRHSGLIFVVAIAAIWLARDAAATPLTRTAAVLLNLSLVASAAYGFVNARLDVRYAFSGSREMAEFIDHRFDGYAIAAHNMYASEALLPYLPGRKFWYPTLGRDATFVDWRFRDDLSYDQALVNARRHFRAKKWLLLLNLPMPDPAQHGYRLIHATSVVVFRHLDERYWLYAPQ